MLQIRPRAAFGCSNCEEDHSVFEAINNKSRTTSEPWCLTVTGAADVETSAPRRDVALATWEHCSNACVVPHVNELVTTPYALAS